MIPSETGGFALSSLQAPATALANLGKKTVLQMSIHKGELMPLVACQGSGIGSRRLRIL